MSWPLHPNAIPLSASTRARMRALWHDNVPPAKIAKLLRAEGVMCRGKQVEYLSCKEGWTVMRPAPPHVLSYHDSPKAAADLARLNAFVASRQRHDADRIALLPHRPPHCCTGRFCCICGGLG